MTEGGVDVTILTSGHDVADARLHREVAALHRAGLRVEVLGLGEASAAPPGSVTRTWARGGLAVRAARAVHLPWRARGEVLVTLDPDTWLGAVPVRMLRRRRTRLVADVHEDYAALLSDRSWARGAAGAAARTLVGVALRAAARTDVTVVADDHVPPHRCRRRVVQRNLPDPSMLPLAGDPDAAPRAVYVGDVRRSRGLFDMLAAVEASPGWELDVVGPVAPDDRHDLDVALARGDLAARVRLHGRLPVRAAWQVAAGAWVGLCLLHDTPAFRRAAPTKVYEYAACGVPVVATDLPGTRAVAGPGAVLLPARSASSDLARLLQGWSADHGGYAALRREAAASAQRFRRDDPYAPFSDAVRSLLDRDALLAQQP